MDMNRRNFLTGGAALAAVGGAATVSAVATDAVAEKDVRQRKPYEGIGDSPFICGAPCLQAPAETTMGVSWAVSGLSKGVVELADNPEMHGARMVKSGGFGLVPIDTDALEVRLEGLKPATRYWYRTITTPFTDYKNIYAAKLGKPVVGDVHSFMTCGASAPAHFCVINDTHAAWKPFQMVVSKIKELKPTAVIWNGDATNTTQSKDTAVKIFLDPPIADKDWSSDVPVFFESGNHDFRGSWISKKEEVVQPRHPAERTGVEWDLKWNFAQRLGALALIGLDTGEDKPDGHPKWFGLANFSAYRVAQAAWLEKALSRPEIASAPFKVVFCHIPLYAAKNHPSYAHDGVKIDPNDFAYWSRECHDLWAPIFERHHITLVICAHEHTYRYDAPDASRSWAQIVGGGCNCQATKTGRFPSVIEGKIEQEKLVVRIHDTFNGCIAGTHEFSRA